MLVFEISHVLYTERGGYAGPEMRGNQSETSRSKTNNFVIMGLGTKLNQLRIRWVQRSLGAQNPGTEIAMQGFACRSHVEKWWFSGALPSALLVFLCSAALARYSAGYLVDSHDQAVTGTPTDHSRNTPGRQHWSRIGRYTPGLLRLICNNIQSMVRFVRRH